MEFLVVLRALQLPSAGTGRDRRSAAMASLKREM